MRERDLAIGAIRPLTISPLTISPAPISAELED